MRPLTYWPLLSLLCVLANADAGTCLDASSVNDDKLILLECARSAEQGEAQSQYILGLYYLRHSDHKKAFSWFRRAAKAGNVGAQNNLGQLYFQGLGVAKNETQAFKWTKQAADQGDVFAEFNLGLFYRDGIGTKLDANKARTWLEKAAQRDYTDAAYALGRMYWQGKLITQDDSKAADWYEKAAQQEDIKGLFSLGVAYELGRGRAQNLREALILYYRAALKGSMDAYNILKQYAESNELDAQSRLGVVHINSEASLLRDAKEGFKWIRVAANRGDVESMYNLGTLYERAVGTEKDRVEAVKWYGRAAVAGYPKALEKMKVIRQGSSSSPSSSSPQ